MLHFCPVSQHSPFVSLGVQDYVFLQLQYLCGSLFHWQTWVNKMFLVPGLSDTHEPKYIWTVLLLVYWQMKSWRIRVPLLVVKLKTLFCHNRMHVFFVGFFVFCFFFKCCRHSNAENADRPSAHWKDQSCCLLYILRAGFVATLEDSSSPKHARCLWKLPQGITGVLSVTLNHSGIDWNPLQSTPSGMTQTTIHWSTWLG